MPKAEAGSTKAIANKMKSKGLQRLRWYCQVCEKQCRDENGFKCHTQSESHVRQMMLVGANPNRVINDFSKDFQRDFLQLLRTAHGTKAVQINHFYQEYIANKEHVHMNATRWPSLTEFAKFLGREGICRVQEEEKGIFIAWIDNSPEAMRRTEAIKRKERMEKGDDEREQRMIREQIQRANAQAKAQQDDGEEQDDEKRALKRDGEEKITLSFGAKKQQPANVQVSKLPSAPRSDEEKSKSPSQETTTTDIKQASATEPATDKEAVSKSTKFSMGGLGASKPKNVFASSKKSGNPLAVKKAISIEQPKKMSEAERIMKEEMERKRGGGKSGLGFGMPGAKRQRVA